jgi:hypothetical protein
VGVTQAALPVNPRPRTTGVEARRLHLAPIGHLRTSDGQGAEA